MKIICSTLIDITVTKNIRSTNNKERNQQRNWETLTQLISLRTQVTVYTEPKTLDDASLAVLGLNRRASRIWTFEFGSEFADIYDISGEPLAALIQDCDNVPLITGLGEAVENLEPVIRTTGPVINTKFLYL